MIRNNIRKFQDFYLHFFKMRDIPKATKLSEIGRKVYNSGICNLPSTNLEKKDEFILLQKKCLEYIKNFNIHEFEKFDVDKFSSIKEIISYSEKKSNAVCIDRNSDFFYSKDSHSYRPIDSNMYDFFQPQYLDSSFRNLIHFFKKFYLNHLIDSLNKSYRKQFIFSHCSLYCYRDNHSPRWIHFDSYKSHIKLFIALNTINTLSFGPYCYVIGSHKNKAFKSLNGQWIIKEKDNHCEVSFEIKFEFKSIILDKIIGVVFFNAVKSIIKAFEEQCLKNENLIP